MAQPTQQNIFLFSGYTPRSTALAERVRKACKKGDSVYIIEDSGHILKKRVQPDRSIVILDLPNIKQSAVKTIRLVKEQSDDTKILAIHIYTTKLLVEPLIEAGANGYLNYEPSVEELREAIHSVSEGERYLPGQIYR